MATAGVSLEATELKVTGGTDSLLTMAAAGVSLAATELKVDTANSDLTMNTAGLTLTAPSVEVTGGTSSFTLDNNGMSLNGKLTVTGGIEAATVGITASDHRLKTDIVLLENSLAKVSKLRG